LWLVFSVGGIEASTLRGVLTFAFFGFSDTLEGCLTLLSSRGVEVSFDSRLESPDRVAISFTWSLVWLVAEESDFSEGFADFSPVMEGSFSLEEDFFFFFLTFSGSGFSSVRLLRRASKRATRLSQLATAACRTAEVSASDAVSAVP